MIATPLALEVRLAQPADEDACRALISRVYADSYGVKLTFGDAEPNGGIETFPDRFAMGEVGGELVACAGLYTREIYVERYGGVTVAEIAQIAREAGVPDAERRPRCEYTKVVVAPSWSHRGVGRRFIGATHARDFLCADGGLPPILLICAKLSTFGLWEAVGIRTRPIKRFPVYRNHDRYRRADDPIESRLVFPERDVDPRWYEMRLPARVSSEPTENPAGG